MSENKHLDFFENVVQESRLLHYNRIKSEEELQAKKIKFQKILRAELEDVLAYLRPFSGSVLNNSTVVVIDSSTLSNNYFYVCSCFNGINKALFEIKGKVANDRGELEFQFKEKEGLTKAELLHKIKTFFVENLRVVS